MMHEHRFDQDETALTTLLTLLNVILTIINIGTVIFVINAVTSG